MKTNKFNLMLICICCFFLQNALSQNTDNFIGFWENEEKTITVEIYKLENSYYGKLLKTTFKITDQNSYDNLIIQMVKRSEKVLYGGTYVDLSTNKSYEIKIKLKDNNHFFMKRFYRFLNKGYYWHRVVN